jgi:hypothetical protein
MRALSILLVLAPLLLVAFAPLASADHVYSHRYIVVGRLVDAAGNPVPDANVSLTLRDLTSEGPCANQPGTETEAFGRTQDRPVTNQWGEFMFCRHVHAMSRALPGTAVLRVEGANVTEEVPLDPYFRISSVVLRLPEPSPRANATALDTAYTVAGRAWQEAGAGVVEGIRVFGTTVDRVPVNVTLERHGWTERVNATTNNYGDFSVRIPVDARMADGRILVEVGGRTFEEAIVPEGFTFLKLNLTPPGKTPSTPTVPTGATPPASPTAATPTSAGTPGTPTVAGGAASETPLSAGLVLAGAAVAALVLARRRA